MARAQASSRPSLLKAAAWLRVPGSVSCDRLAGQAHGIKLEPFVAAGVAADDEAAGAGDGLGVGDRLIEEGELGARGARRGDAVELVGRAEAGGDQHRAVGQPVAEHRLAVILVALDRGLTSAGISGTFSSVAVPTWRVWTGGWAVVCAGAGEAASSSEAQKR